MGSPEKVWFPEERKQIADQIKKARKSEREGNEQSYGIDRSGKECLYRIGGLKRLFEYIRSLSSNKVLDVGVGTGRGSCVISQMPISTGFNFEVTALRNTPELQQNFPKDKIHITEVETLRGIPAKSLAGVIGVNSIGYSDHPYLAVKKLDQVLIDGGVIKATFHSLGESEGHNDTVFKGPTKFIEALSALGYDVSLIKKNFFFNSNYNAIDNSIVIAIKPGNPDAPRAEELLNLDFDSIKSEGKKVLPSHDTLIFDTED